MSDIHEHPSESGRPIHDYLRDQINALFREIALGPDPESHNPHLNNYLGAAGITLYPWGAERLE